MAYIYDIADLWNASGTVFTGIKLNVTDTASAAGSLLMDLQVGGVSRFSVRKDGAILGPVGITVDAANSFGALTLAGSNQFIWANGSCRTVGTFGIGGTDLILARDAANTLAQRNGVNAQAFNLYNTHTDASNFERGFMRWSGNRLQIGMEKAGTGSDRILAIVNPGAVEINAGAGGDYFRFGVNNGGSVSLSSHGLTNTGITGADVFIFRRAPGIMAITTGSSGAGGASMELLEQTAPAAPATDRVRIYAEDNGSGKTRLMAVFATGAAVQIAIEP